MDNGILKIETDYSENDFQIDWSDVKTLHTARSFIIYLSNKYRVKGTITMDKNNPEYLIINPENGSKLFSRITDIVYLKSNEQDFWDRFSANIDGGYSLTKASNSINFSLSGAASYINTKFKTDIYFNLINNKVDDDTTEIKTNRNNWGGTGYVYFKESWYVMSAADFLQNNEQNLDLRTTLQSGVGKYLLYDHRLYLSTTAGLALNNERFSTKDETVNSMEVFGQFDFNGYNFNDISISTKLQLFTNVDVSRFRSVFFLKVKFDLPLDFYMGAETSLNYDSSPDADSPSTDYVIQTTFGWKF